MRKVRSLCVALAAAGLGTLVLGASSASAEDCFGWSPTDNQVSPHTCLGDTMAWVGDISWDGMGGSNGNETGANSRPQIVVVGSNDSNRISVRGEHYQDGIGVEVRSPSGIEPYTVEENLKWNYPFYGSAFPNNVYDCLPSNPHYDENSPIPIDDPWGGHAGIKAVYCVISELEDNMAPYWTPGSLVVWAGDGDDQIDIDYSTVTPHYNGVSEISCGDGTDVVRLKGVDWVGSTYGDCETIESVPY